MRQFIKSVDITASDSAGQLYFSLDVDFNFLRTKFVNEMLRKYFTMVSTNICFDIYLQSHFQQVGLLGITSNHMPPLAIESLGFPTTLDIATLQKLPTIYKKMGSNWMVSIEIPWTSPEKFMSIYEKDNYYFTRLLVYSITPFRTLGNPLATMRVYAYLKGLEYSGWHPR